jgi:hypothetical protein
MMKNLVVVKFLDGKMVKGNTRDFMPKREEFHVQDENNPEDSILVEFSRLKAVFFVKTVEGNKNFVESSDLSRKRMYGKQLEVGFLDGEVIKGYTQSYNPKDRGFFMFPADEESNNERIFVVKSSTRYIKFF